MSLLAPKPEDDDIKAIYFKVIMCILVLAPLKTDNIKEGVLELPKCQTFLYCRLTFGLCSLCCLFKSNKIKILCKQNQSMKSLTLSKSHVSAK